MNNTPMGRHMVLLPQITPGGGRGGKIKFKELSGYTHPSYQYVPFTNNLPV